MKVTISVVYNVAHHQSVLCWASENGKGIKSDGQRVAPRNSEFTHVKEIFIISTQAAAEDAVPQADLNPTADPSPVMQPHPSHRPDIDWNPVRRRLLLAL